MDLTKLVNIDSYILKEKIKAKNFGLNLVDLVWGSTVVALRL